jgi:hypothetical protein
MKVESVSLFGLKKTFCIDAYDPSSPFLLKTFGDKGFVYVDSIEITYREDGHLILDIKICQDTGLIYTTRIAYSGDYSIIESEKVTGKLTDEARERMTRSARRTETTTSE